MAIFEILPFFGVHAREGIVVAPVGGFNLAYHSLGPLRDIQYDRGTVVVKDVTESFRKTPDFAQISKAPNPLFSDKHDMNIYAKAALMGLDSRRLLAIAPILKGSYSVKLVGARETETITVLAVKPRPATISFRYLKYTGPWPPDGPGSDESRFSRGVSRSKSEGSVYANEVDQILRHQALITVTLQSSEDVNFSKPFGPQVNNVFFKRDLRPLYDKAADVTVFVVPMIDGAEGRKFSEDTTSAMVAENPNLLLLDNSYPVDYFALVVAHELAHALGAPHNNQVEGLLMSGAKLKQGLLIDRDMLYHINSPQPDSGKKK